MQAVHLLPIDADHQGERIADLHIVGYLVLVVVDLHVAAGHGYLVVAHILLSLLRGVRIVHILLVQVVVRLLLVQRSSIVPAIVTAEGLRLLGMLAQVLLGLNGGIAALVGASHMVAASQVGDELQMRLQHDGVEEFDSAIVLKVENNNFKS